MKIKCTVLTSLRKFIEEIFNVCKSLYPNSRNSPSSPPPPPITTPPDPFLCSHSHSVVPGGFAVKSYIIREIP